MDLVARWWLPALVASFGFRLWYCWWRALVPDEAVYWSWSRHLELSYFDHPPMVAYLIWLSTRVFGSTELGVRFGTALLGYAAAFILIVATRHILRFDSRTTALVALIWLTSPLLMGLATLSTPDTPALFFSICAMTTALWIATRNNASGLYVAWLLFGLFCGLALLSKYTTILVPGSVFLALLTSRQGRSHLKRPGIYISGVVALIIFSPVIYWNYRHDWASFRFQLAHGFAGDDRNGFAMLVEWIGGQALIWTPLMFAITVAVLFRFWRGVSGLDLQNRILLLCATVPLVFFAYSGFRSRGEANWPAFAYFPASILVANYVAQHWHGERWKWTLIACILAFGGMIAAQFPEPMWALRIPWVKKMDELVDWREWGRQLDTVAKGLPVIANRQQDAGEAGFYLPGQPDVWAASSGSRPTAFDYMSNAPDIRSLPRLLFLGSHVTEFCAEYGFTPGETGRLTIVLPSGRSRTRTWTIMERDATP